VQPICWAYERTWPNPEVQYQRAHCPPQYYDVEQGPDYNVSGNSPRARFYQERGGVYCWAIATITIITGYPTWHKIRLPIRPTCCAGFILIGNSPHEDCKRHGACLHYLQAGAFF